MVCITGSRFYSHEEVIIAFNEGKLDLHAAIKVRAKAIGEEGQMTIKLIDTTVGRVLLNQAVPEKVPFINELATKKTLKKIISCAVHIFCQ